MSSPAFPLCSVKIAVNITIEFMFSLILIKLTFWLLTDDEDAQEPLTFDDEENEIPTTVFTGFKDSGKR